MILSRLVMIAILILSFNTNASSKKITFLHVGDCIKLTRLNTLCYSGFNGFNVIISIEKFYSSPYPERALSTQYYLTFNDKPIAFQSTEITYIKKRDGILIKY